MMNLYENAKTPIRAAYFGFVLIAIGFLLQNESVNIFYTFSSSFSAIFSKFCLSLGQIIIINLPLLFMLNMVCKKANGAYPILLALVGYFSFLAMTAIFADSSLTSQAYVGAGSAASVFSLTNLGKSPLEFGLPASIVVAYLTRLSFIRSRHRGDYDIFGFMSPDSEGLVLNILLCCAAGLTASFVYPIFYKYLQLAINFIASDLLDPLGLALYGFLDRFLSLLGLGSLIRYPFWYTSLGGSFTNLAGQAILGDVSIFAYIQENNALYYGCGRFITAYYVINFFMIPALYFGIMTGISDKKERHRLMPVMILASLLSIIAGNPLPFEILMAFTTPFLLLLYLLVVAAVYYFLAYFGIYLGSSVGTTSIISAMPGSFPDFIINIRNTLYYDTLIKILAVGAVAAACCFLLSLIYHRFLAYDFIASGRLKKLADDIIESVGGKENIVMVSTAYLRLNITLNNQEELDYDKINEWGKLQVLETKDGISISTGSSAWIIAHKIRKTIEVKNG